MNTFQIIWLIYQLYFKRGLPDLKRIEKLGLLAVKIGQIHALRLDFLPVYKCDHLAKLYQTTQPSGREVLDTALNESGQKLLRSVAWFDKEPLASASVGQVYRAELTDGREVVIKVLRSDFKTRFKNDLLKAKRFFRLIIFFYPKLRQVGNPIGILEDIETYTLCELDLRNELAGQDQLRVIYEKYRLKFDLSALGFFQQHRDLSGENVLVSEYIKAPSVNDLLMEGRFSYEDMLKLFYIQGFYIFIAGSFHGDIHPGNVLYDGQKFYFVDTAFVGQVSDKLRVGLFNFFRTLSSYDYDDCAYWLNQMSETSISGEAFEIFRQQLNELYRDFKGSTVEEVSLTRKMMQTIKLGVRRGMTFEQGMFSIIRSLMYLDGMVLKCNPQAVLMEDMRQFINDYQDHLN